MKPLTTAVLGIPYEAELERILDPEQREYCRTWKSFPYSRANEPIVRYWSCS